MKRVLLHIGRHKSGTSSLQRFLYENPNLLGDCDVVYPRFPGQRGVAHHHFASQLTKRNFPFRSWYFRKAHVDDICAPLISSLSDDCLNVISSEAFQNCDPRLVRRVLRNCDVDVAVYIRNEVDYIASSYAQRVHASQLAFPMERYAKTFRLDYAEFLRDWSRAFDGRLQVRVFDRAHLFGGCIVRDFFKNSLGVELSPSVEVGSDANVSLTRRTLAEKLYVNTLGDVAKQPGLYKFFSQRAASDLNSGKVRIVPELKSKLVKTFSAKQESWCRQFFGESAIFDYDAVVTSTPYSLSQLEVENLFSDLRAAGFSIN